MGRGGVSGRGTSRSRSCWRTRHRRIRTGQVEQRQPSHGQRGVQVKSQCATIICCPCMQLPSIHVYTRDARMLANAPTCVRIGEPCPVPACLPVPCTWDRLAVPILKLHPIYVQSCRACGIAFSSFASLAQHLATKHGGLNSEDVKFAALRSAGHVDAGSTASHNFSLEDSRNFPELGAGLEAVASQARASQTQPPAKLHSASQAALGPQSAPTAESARSGYTIADLMSAQMGSRAMGPAAVGRMAPGAKPKSMGMANDAIHRVGKSNTAHALSARWVC